MSEDTKRFIERQEQKLAAKYARRSFRQLVRKHATSTKEQMADIDRAYRQFIETPVDDYRTI